MKKRRTYDVISTSRNASVHLYFNLKYVVSCKITCIYKAKNGEYILNMILVMVGRERVAETIDTHPIIALGSIM